MNLNRKIEAPATLEDLKPGAMARVARVEGEQAFCDRLSDLGFLPGTEISVVRVAPLGDPLEVALRGYHLAIRRTDARKVLLAGLR